MNGDLKTMLRAGEFGLVAYALALIFNPRAEPPVQPVQLPASLNPPLIMDPDGLGGQKGKAAFRIVGERLLLTINEPGMKKPAEELWLDLQGNLDHGHEGPAYLNRRRYHYQEIWADHSKTFNPT